MNVLPSEPLDPAEHEAIAAHLMKVTPLLAATFGAIPIVYVTYPQGLDKAPVFHKGLDQGPETISTVEVRTSAGLHRYVLLNEHNVTWLARGRFAVELQSWSPTATDPARAAYARITINPSSEREPDDGTRALLLLREALQAQDLDGIPLLDGGAGYALWIPLAGGPEYDALASWLRAFVREVVAAHPELMSDEHLRAKRGDRVSIGIQSNHPGMSTVMPYIARGRSNLPIALPLRWEEVGVVRNNEVTAASFDAWFTAHGDLFSSASRELRGQSLPNGTHVDPFTAREAAAITVLSLACNVSGEQVTWLTNAPMIAAAARILQDGRSLKTAEILAEGIALGLFPATLTQKRLHTDLYEYILRMFGEGKAPELLFDATAKTFRLNRPPDPWPAIALPPLPRWLDDATVEGLAAAVSTTATGDDPAAFEVAVCDAFAALGFAATHFGGHAEPDGTLDAQLGRAGYRVILECKTAKPGNVVSNPRAEEPASFKEAYHAQKALLIGPAFNDEVSLRNELVAHSVALWTVADLLSMLRAQVGPDELRPALEPGVAGPACEELLWARDHGRRKRIAVISASILNVGWTAQADLAGKVAPGETPVLTKEAFFLLVDTLLTHSGVTTGASEEEYAAAFSGLLASGALREDGAESGGYIVVQPSGALIGMG